MPTIKTGKTRSLTLNVTRTGEDGSTSSFVLDGKINLGPGFPAIDDAQLAALTDQQFNDRIGAWKTYVENTYSTTEPDLYGYIVRAFDELNGVVVRIYELTGNYAAATTYPVVPNGQINLEFKNSTGGTVHLVVNEDIYVSLNPVEMSSSSETWTDPLVRSETISGLNLECIIDTDMEYNIPPNMFIQKSETNTILKVYYNIIDRYLISDGDEVGICWSVTPSPNLGDSYNYKQHVSGGQNDLYGASGEGSFYVRGYYIHNGAIEYSNELFLTVVFPL